MATQSWQEKRGVKKGSGRYLVIQYSTRREEQGSAGAGLSIVESEKRISGV